MSDIQYRELSADEAGVLDTALGALQAANDYLTGIGATSARITAETAAVARLLDLIAGGWLVVKIDLEAELQAMFAEADAALDAHNNTDEA